MTVPTVAPEKKPRRARRFITKVVDDVIEDLLVAFLFMLFLGVAHSFDHRIPAFGYWAGFFLLWALGCPVSVAIHGYKRWNKHAWRS